MNRSLKVQLRGDTWYAMGTVRGPDGERHRVRRSTGFRRHEKKFAEREANRICDEIARGIEDKMTRDVTLWQAIDLYLDRPDHPGETNSRVLMSMGRKFGKRYLRKLDMMEISQHINGRGNSAGTVAREAAAFNAMLEYAKKHGIKVPRQRLVVPKVNDRRDRFLSAAERDELIGAMHPHARPLLIFLFFMGCRLGEAMNLRWRSVVGHHCVFSTRKTKGGITKKRSVPMPKVVRENMPDRTGLGADDLVFVNTLGGKWSRAAFGIHFREACAKVGIEDFRPHDCRHTYASLLVQRGASLKAVAELLGHSRIEQTNRYAHYAPSHLNDTVGLLDESAEQLSKGVTPQDGGMSWLMPDLGGPRRKKLAQLTQNDTVLTQQRFEAEFLGFEE